VSPVVALAALAGALAAVALADAAEAWAAHRGRRARGSRRPALLDAIAGLGRRVARPSASAGLEGRLAAAGAPLGLTLADVLALKAGSAAVGCLLALPLAAAAPGRLGLVVLLAVPAAGFLAPDLALARRAALRGRAMAREAADVLDLLRVAVEAGLSPTRALHEVGRRHPGPLAAELGRTAAEIDLGVPRASALATLATRCPLPEVAALAAAIGRADRHGAPLGPALHALATEARAEHARRVREAGARAAPQIQLVVALLLVPAVMLLIAAALVQALLPAG
jgi:tight adherence protein C